jgi:hypothetical protein
MTISGHRKMEILCHYFFTKIPLYEWHLILFSLSTSGKNSPEKKMMFITPHKKRKKGKRK